MMISSLWIVPFATPHKGRDTAIQTRNVHTRSVNSTTLPELIRENLHDAKKSLT
ncbi:hypothetical protein [Jonesia quinghaiensis]|uniref:hypothetical protein n=1 Tax=Jonesia quinghaiensis TaxID=262806 RepID=UPI00040F4BAE|nr:hypothetical protein [Jonesia quinghaiensis]